MSPWLFNVYIYGVVREMNLSVLGQGLKLLEASGLTGKLSQLLMVDNTTLVAVLQEKLCLLRRSFGGCLRGGICVIVGKSQVMRCFIDAGASRIIVRLNLELL